MKTAVSSGLKSASTAIATRPAIIASVTLVPASADATLTIYDSSSAASGKELWQSFAKAGTGALTVPVNLPIEALNGIYASLAGTGATYIVHYALL